MGNKTERQDVVITIHGREYKIQSLKDVEYTEKLAKFCDEVMKSTQAGTGSNDYLKLLVLSLLQVAHKYFQSTSGKDKSNMVSDAELSKIIKSIEKTQKEVAKLEEPSAYGK